MVWPYALGPWINLGVLVAVAWLGGFVLFVITVRRVDGGAHLQRPGWYRGVLGLQLALAATGIVMAGRTVFAHGSPGFISLACADLLAGVVTYRAIVRPSPTRALWSSLCASCVAFYALIADLLLDHRSMQLGHPSGADAGSPGVIAMLTIAVQPAVAAMVGLAVVNVFGAQTNLPDAKASLHPDHHDPVD